MALRARQVVELFHLQVLRVLGGSMIRAHLALKGGCNLRLFFGSVRYSEDMDVDADRALELHVLREKMDQLLAGAALNGALRVAGIELGAVSAPKQTETTQRWKVELRLRGKPLSLRTKVEFSPRPTTEEATLEAVDPKVVQAYQMLPLLVRHYPLQAAIGQKVRALVGRKIVQARDVFDLSILLARSGGKLEAASLDRALVSQSVERAMDVGYDEYVGQVVAFLEPERAEEYGSREAWNALQAKVVEVLDQAVRP